MWKSCKNHAATQREQNFSHSEKWDLLLSFVPSHSLQISADLSLENPGEYFTTILPLIEWKKWEWFIFRKHNLELEGKSFNS